MATPFTVRSMTTSATTSKSTGTTMSAEAVISAASEVTGGGRGGGRGEAVATVTSEVTGTRGDGDDMVMLWVEGVAAAASDEITGAGGAVDRDPPAEQVEAQFEPAWEGGLLSDWLGGL
jgi:hypothetical protein